MHLVELTDVLGAKPVYALLAHASLFARRFRVCSKAFTKLEAMGAVEERQRFEDLAFDLFSKHPPQDEDEVAEAMCYNCMSSIKERWGRCITACEHAFGCGAQWAYPSQPNTPLSTNPNNPPPHSDTSCPACHVHFSTCIASGRPITDPQHFICPVCKQRAYEGEIMQCKCCPLVGCGLVWLLLLLLLNDAFSWPPSPNPPRQCHHVL
jgi:WD repeat-containing protein 35